MKLFLPVVILLLSGCFYFGKDTYGDIVERDPSNWSSRECLTVILSCMVNNFRGDGTIQVIATPYYPSVILALNRIQQTEQHLSDAEAREKMDELLRAGTGLYREHLSGQYVSARGNYLREKTDIDSLMMLITLKNTAWPLHTPDIADIERRIALVNNLGDTVRPIYIWGRNNDLLTNLEETLLAMFSLRRNGKHFWMGAHEMKLVLKDLDVGNEAHLRFPLAKVH